MQRVPPSRRGCQSCHAARCPLVGIELRHMLKKKQGVLEAGERVVLRPNSFTPAPPNDPLTEGNSPHIVDTPNFATYMDPPTMSRGG